MTAITIRRCTTQRGAGIHATTEARFVWAVQAWDGRTLCGKLIREVVTSVAGGDGPGFVPNTSPVTCTRCLAALAEIGEAIAACIEGGSEWAAAQNEGGAG